MKIENIINEIKTELVKLLDVKVDSNINNMNDLINIKDKMIEEITETYARCEIPNTDKLNKAISDIKDYEEENLLYSKIYGNLIAYLDNYNVEENLQMNEELTKMAKEMEEESVLIETTDDQKVEVELVIKSKRGRKPKVKEEIEEPVEIVEDVVEEPIEEEITISIPEETVEEVVEVIKNSDDTVDDTISRFETMTSDIKTELKKLKLEKETELISGISGIINRIKGYISTNNVSEREAKLENDLTEFVVFISTYATDNFLDLDSILNLESIQNLM